MLERSLNILLVEDSPVDALLLQEALRRVPTSRFNVTHVGRLTDALARLGQERFDLVLLDLGLPESTGLETFRRLQTHVPDVAIVVLSGLDDEEVAVTTVQEGAEDYLVKGQVGGELLARTIRYAVERKRVQEELHHRDLELRQDLQLACEFQQAFLPHQDPCFPPDVPRAESALQFAHRYVPSGGVGGDFYDLLRLSDSQAGLFVCDVMGHGVRAALVTAMIRGFVDQQRPAAADPGQFLAGINRGLAEVLRQADTTMFATAVYLAVDVATARARYATAGHPAPLHLQRQAGQVVPLASHPETNGSVLGLFPDTNYPTTSVPVAAGDLILVVTDGLFESLNAAGEEYGQERLRQAVQRRLQLPAEQLLDELLQDVLQFSGRTTFLDDVCLLSVEVRQLGPSPAP